MHMPHMHIHVPHTFTCHTYMHTCHTHTRTHAHMPHTYTCHTHTCINTCHIRSQATHMHTCHMYMHTCHTHTCTHATHTYTHEVQGGPHHQCCSLEGGHLEVWRRKWQPTAVFLPGESQGQRSLMGCRLWVSQSRTRLKRLSSSSTLRLGLPGGSVVKNPPANAGDTGWSPGLGRSPGIGNGNPFLPEKFRGQRRLAGYNPWGG